jgi:hypothetical protein
LFRIPPSKTCLGGGNPNLLIEDMRQGPTEHGGRRHSPCTRGSSHHPHHPQSWWADQGCSCLSGVPHTE